MKLATILAIFCLSLGTAEAQSRLELIGGLSVSWFRVDGPKAFENEPFNGWFAGVRWRQNWTEHFYTAASFQESLRGYGQKTAITATTNRLLCTDFHALAGYDFDHRWSFAVGGFVSRLGQQRQRLGPDGSWDTPVVGIFRDFDYGATLEAEFEWRNLSFFARHNIGIGKIAEIDVLDGTTVLGSQIYRDQFFQLGIGASILHFFKKNE